VYRPAAMPVSALVPFSIVESEAASYRDARSGPEGWARHCWLAAGRGTLHHDLYVAPDSLSDGEWAVLSEALRWARDHHDVLARSRMVLGDPAAGEVYGFAARRGHRATLCLRNPAAVPQPVDAALPDLLDFEPAAIRTVYGRPPAGLEPITLDPFEVLVLEASEAPPLR
jgi:GNAT superfamily N-acetyltransferase